MLIIRCKGCGIRLYSWISKEKGVCGPCDPDSSPGGKSAAEFWMESVQNA